MDPLITSALVQTGGSLLSGLLGGKKKRGPSFQDQLAMNGMMIDNTMGSTMAAAEKHGVHPLYALGAPLSPSINFTAGGDDREPRMNRMAGAAADMGQNIGRAIYARGTPEERAFAKITAQQALERGHLENELLKSQIAQIRTSGPGNAVRSPDPRYPSQNVLPIGVSSAQPRYLPMVNPDGSITNVTNPDAGDNEFVMAWDFLSKTMPDEAKNLFNRSFKNFKSLKKGFRKGGK